MSLTLLLEYLKRVNEQRIQILDEIVSIPGYAAANPKRADSMRKWKAEKAQQGYVGAVLGYVGSLLFDTVPRGSRGGSNVCSNVPQGATVGPTSCMHLR